MGTRVDETLKTVLVTGGAGYIGSHVAKAFSERGYRVIVVDNLVHGHRDFVKWGPLIEGDIGDSVLLDSIFAKHRIDIVCHFAAFAYVGESMGEPLKYYENNIANALCLLNCALKGKVKVFQFSSSCATYGQAIQVPITETHPQIPLSPYGKSKLFFEVMLKDIASIHNTRFSILRYFNAAGADPDLEVGEDHTPETHLIPLTLAAAFGHRTALDIFGTNYDTPDGTCIRDYIHVTDLAAAHVLAVEKTLSSGNTIYNLGNEEGFSVKEVVENIRRFTGRRFAVIERDKRPGDPDKLIGSSQRIKADLGWQPKYSSLDTIIDTAGKWYRKRFPSEQTLS